MKKILLLGGTGTISYSVMHRALEKGFDVSVLNRGKRGKKLPQSVTSIICDLKDDEKLKTVISNTSFDVIVDFFSRNPSDIERLYSVLAKNCKQYIFISSSCIYRRAKEDFPIVETSPAPNKDWLYNVQKYETEQKLIQLYENSEQNACYTIVRPYITYDEERLPLGIAPAYKYHRTILERIKKGKPMFLWDSGEAVVTLTSAKDFSVALVGLFDNPKAKNEAFHITSDFSYSWREIYEHLYKKINVQPNIVYLSSEKIAKEMPNYKEMLLGDRKLNAVFDNSKIKAAVPELNFSVSLDEGLDGVLDYYRKLDSYDYDYMYDAQIDRMLAKVGVKNRYVQYRGSEGNRLEYVLFRYLPYRIAMKIRKLILKFWGKRLIKH